MWPGNLTNSINKLYLHQLIECSAEGSARGWLAVYDESTLFKANKKYKPFYCEGVQRMAEPRI